MKGIEIPFGAKDSELCGWEYTIPEGMEAVVKDGKVIVRRKESEDERIIDDAIQIIRASLLRYAEYCPEADKHRKAIAYLEKQKEQPMSAEDVLIRAGLKPYRDGNQWCVLAGGDIQEGICGFGDTIDEALYQFLMEVLKIQKEQKPAEWSEEDKGHIQLLIDFLNSCQMYVPDSIRVKIREQIHGHITWLKALKNRGNFSKSNTNSSHWKPSEEQMEALAWYSGNSGIPPTGDKAIKSLYNDLQKLL